MNDIKQDLITTLKTTKEMLESYLQKKCKGNYIFMKEYDKWMEVIGVNIEIYNGTVINFDLVDNNGNIHCYVIDYFLDNFTHEKWTNLKIITKFEYDNDIHLNGVR